MLLFLNYGISPAPGGQLAPIGPGEFKKLVYESKFTKRAKEMSFVNSERVLFRA